MSMTIKGSKELIIKSEKERDELRGQLKEMKLELISLHGDDMTRSKQLEVLTNTNAILKPLLSKFMNLSSHKNVHDAIAELSYCKGLKDMFTHQQNMVSVITSISAKSGGIKGA